MVNTRVDVRCLYVYPVGVYVELRQVNIWKEKSMSGFTLVV